MDVDLVAVGARVRAARRRAGLSQRDVGSRASWNCPVAGAGPTGMAGDHSSTAIKQPPSSHAHRDGYSTALPTHIAKANSGSASSPACRIAPLRRLSRRLPRLASSSSQRYAEPILLRWWHAPLRGRTWRVGHSRDGGQ